MSLAIKPPTSSLGLSDSNVSAALTATLPATPAPASASPSLPDWSRERGLHWSDPGPRLLASVRSYQYWRARGGILGKFLSRFYVLTHRFWSIAAAAEIPLNSHIAGGFKINHPNGIVIHPDATIGPNCLVMQQVTIGEGPTPGLPTIGANCFIGAGAKVLGGITIGDHAKIGANAVVLCDVPPHSTAVGIPARIIPPKPTPAAA